MYVFNHQRDPKYLAKLNSVLSIDNLLKTAIPLKNPKIIHKVRYDRCLRIDFSGISALLLHDTTTLPSSDHVELSKVQENFEKIFENTKLFNDKGIFLSLRFLLVYPYCSHAQSRIQAEFSKNRATIQEQEYTRNWALVEPVTETTFNNSSLLQTQNNLLSFLQDKIHSYDYFNSSLNRLKIRFVPMAINQSILCINNEMFCVSYLLAKLKRIDHRLVSCAPIIQITKDEHAENFDAYIDHFRYLWELPQTIDSEDAIEIDHSTFDFKRIKPPFEINYKKKAERVHNKLGMTKPYDKKGNESNHEVFPWERSVKYLLDHDCPRIPKKAPDSETIFLACSWDRDVETANKHALQLEELLLDDFKYFKVNITLVDGDGGASVKKSVYESLNSTTVGLILFTKDIKSGDDVFYSRPNIYQELGYLMGRLESYDEDVFRVIPVIEEGVCLASNVSDKIGHRFSSNHGIILVYHKIIYDLLKIFDFDDKIKISFFNRHLQRLTSTLSEDNRSEKLIKTITQVKRYIKNLTIASS